MTRRKTPSKSSGSGSKRKAPAPDLLDRLSPVEAVAVLQHLLEKHPELRPEAEQFATKLVSAGSVEDIAEDVGFRITSIGLDDLNERAGSHFGEYVGPSEGAYDLLEEAIEEWIEDMKRRAELGMMSSAETVCAGIVTGLYEVRNTSSDDALGWASDFPVEKANRVVVEFLEACCAADRKAARKRVMEILAKQAPDWMGDLQYAADQVTKE